MNKPKQAISIMADFGNGPYVWCKDASDTTRYVGRNIADVLTGFPDELPVSKNLEQQFCRWVIQFERYSNKEWFDWKAFHNTGRSLTQLLANELGDSYIYYYHKPLEAPDCEIERIVEIDCNKQNVSK